MTARSCPCGHALDPDGDPDQYGCLNGLIYGPCGEDVCYGRCADSHGRCKSLDGCCDPESNMGRSMTSADPEPPVGTVVLDAHGNLWRSYGKPPCEWMQPGVSGAELGTWAKIAGNYGPVTIQEWGDHD